MNQKQRKMISFRETVAFSARDVAFAEKLPVFKEFQSYETSQEGILQAIVDRRKYPVNREILCEVLEDQYRKIDNCELQLKAIKALSQSNTFTVITAHQPSLFLGPLYTIYKAISAIKLAKQIQSVSKEDKIIPVFIVGGEDHDFEEINHCNVFGKKIEWENNEIGPVGHMSTDTISKCITELSELVGSRNRVDELMDILSSYNESISFGNATQIILHKILGHFGILVLQMDDARLKREFIPTLKKEILLRLSKDKIETTQSKIKELGFKSQTHVRDINLFYINDLGRNRIVFEDGRYQVLSTRISWDEDSILAEIDTNPERFSPNVNLRPIYQESILPNIAYVGGGGEIAYWLERKSQFEAYDCFFPVLIRRDSFMMISHKEIELLSSLNFQLTDFFNPTETLVKTYLNSVRSEQYTIDVEKAKIIEVYDQLLDRITHLDTSLGKSASAELSKTMKGLNHIETKLNRLLKNKQEVSIKRIEKIKSSLFPDGKLQERYDSFIKYYLLHGEEWLDKLLSLSDPLDMRLKIVFFD